MNTTIDLRKKNTLIALRAIVEFGPITKVDIALKTDLTLMTINTIVNNLLKKNIIKDFGIAESTSGRKATLYAVDPSAYYIVGVNIGVDQITCAITDFDLNTKDITSVKIHPSYTPTKIINLIYESIIEILEKNKITTRGVLGIGVTVPGLVEELNGMVHSLPNIKGWVEIVLKDILENKLNVTVFVEKDNHASVLYLKRNISREYKNVVSLTVKGGIGTGILLNGSLYRGEHGIAGEIGHISLDANGPKCNCGNLGCLEVYSSDMAIVKEVKNNILTDKDLDIDDIIMAAKKGDEAYCKAILDAASYIAIAVCNTLYFYDPGYFLINCKWINEIPQAKQIITKTVNDKCTLLRRQKINIQFNYEEHAYLKGAVFLVFDYMLNNITHTRLL